MKTWFNKLTNFQKCWICGSTLAIFLLGIIAGDTPMNIAIGTIGMFYVSVYSTGTTKWAFILGIVYVALYSVICLQNRIVLDAYQNAILIPIYYLSFRHWGKDAVTPRNLSNKQRMYTALMLAVTITCFYEISILLNGNYSILDAINTACTLFAMILGYFGYSENWACWTINNAVSALTFGLVLFTPTGSLVVFAMKMIFFINGLIGWYNWRKASN